MLLQLQLSTAARAGVPKPDRTVSTICDSGDHPIVRFVSALLHHCRHEVRLPHDGVLQTRSCDSLACVLKRRSAHSSLWRACQVSCGRWFVAPRSSTRSLRRPRVQAQVCVAKNDGLAAGLPLRRGQHGLGGWVPIAVIGMHVRTHGSRTGGCVGILNQVFNACNLSPPPY